MNNKTIIITNPNLTTLFVGQLISETSLPKLLEENFVTIDDIEFVPYEEKLHKSYIEKSTKIYDHLTQKDYNKIH